MNLIQVLLLILDRVLHFSHLFGCVVRGTLPIPVGFFPSINIDMYSPYIAVLLVETRISFFHWVFDASFIALIFILRPETFAVAASNDIELPSFGVSPIADLDDGAVRECVQNISLRVEPKRDAVTITIKALCTPPVVPASIVIIVEDVGSWFVSTLVWQCETEQLLSSSSQALFLDALESLELW